MPFVQGFGQSKGNPGPCPDHRGFFDAELHGHRIRGFKTDTPDVARQPIGVFRDQLDRIGAIGLIDPNRARCSDTIGMQKDHDLADDPLIGPTRGDALCPLRSNAGDFPQPMWLRFDNVEHVVPEGPSLRA